MKITVYTINDCPFSKQEKEYLTSHSLTYEEKNLESNKEFLTEMLAVSNNFAGTPVTKIEKDDGQIAVLKGFTKDEFDKTLGFTSSAPAPAAEPSVPKVEPNLPNVAVAEASMTMPTVTPQADPPAPPQPNPAPEPLPPVPTPEPPTPVNQTNTQTTMPELPPLQSAESSFSMPVDTTTQAPVMSSPAVTPPVPAQVNEQNDKLNSLLQNLQSKLDTNTSVTSAPQTPTSGVPQTTAGGLPNIPEPNFS